MKTEFQKILNDKIKGLDQHQNGDKKTSSHSIFFQTSVTNDPLHLSYLLATLEKSTSNSFKNKSYFVKKRPEEIKKDNFKKDTKPFTEAILMDLNNPPEAPEKLTPKQKNAWLWFWKMGAPLKPQWTFKELQRNFRKLAFQVHPDKNLSPEATENFRQLREHYQILKID